MKKIINNFLAFINRHVQTEKKYWINRKFSGKHLLKNIEKTDHQTYERLKSFRESEHQIGRYINMKKIFEEINQDNISGDVVEFGTWQGDGMCILDKAICKFTKKKIIGIDSFEGLPHNSTIWHKGTFNDTNIKIVEKKLEINLNNFKKFKLIKGWFNEKKVADELYEYTNDLCVIHFDADLGKSTLDIFKIIEPYLKKVDHPVYFLFDDWGIHPNEIPEAFNTWYKEFSSKVEFKLILHSNTNLTRYYKLEF